MCFPIRKHRVRLPHIRIELRKFESRREDADDLGRSAVQLEGRADSIEGAGETGLPEAIANQGEALPFIGLSGREGAPIEQLNAEQ